jgi:hypothetical protein
MAATLDPWIGLSESDPKLYTNFEFYEIKSHKVLNNILIYKAEKYILTILYNNIHILEDGVSGV